MQTHFGEEFRLLTPSEFSAWRNLTGAENVWRQFDQFVCPADSIKPIERRRGWSRDKLEAHNQERLGDLIDAGWDLIICDEAHRLGGSTEQVARYRLGRALAEAAPYLLLLSATPHQGKTAGFQRLMALLDRDEFIAAGSIRKEKVVRFVIRTEKRRAIPPLSICYAPQPSRSAHPRFRGNETPSPCPCDTSCPRNRAASRPRAAAPRLRRRPSSAPKISSDDR